MCGIFGILDKYGKGLDGTDLDVFTEMGIITQLRGRHSSGMFVVDGKSVNKPPRIVKALGPSVNLEWEKEYESVAQLIRTTACAAIGHGRHATVGKITKKNAHPFSHNGITLVHNGTIRNGLEDQLKEVEVDSHALTMKIAEKGVINALHEIDGAFAVILHDQKDGKIYIARNYERPLFYYETYNRIYIMSDPGALEYLNRRNNLWSSHSTADPFQIDKVYVFDPVGGKLMIEDEIPKKYYYTTQPPPTQISYQQPTKSTSSALSVVKKTPSVSGGVKTIEPSHYKKGENVEFIVRGSFRSVTEGTYFFKAVDDEGRNIWFKTDKAHPEWHGRTGVGQIVALHLDLVEAESNKYEWSYQLKTRGIIWDDDTTSGPEEDIVETQDCIITKKTWKEICEKNVCKSCLSSLDESDPEGTYVWETAKGFTCLCPSCTEHAMNFVTNSNEIGAKFLQ